MSDDEHDTVHLNPGTTQVQAQDQARDDDEPQTDTPSSPAQEDQASPDDSAGEEGPGSTMEEEEAPQGGGAQSAAVTKGKFRSFHLTQSPDTDRISKVTWYYEGNTHVTKKRPLDDAPDSALWMLMEMQTAKAKKRKAAEAKRAAEKKEAAKKEAEKKEAEKKAQEEAESGYWSNMTNGVASFSPPWSQRRGEV